MDYKRLGHSGLAVSTIGLGTGGFGSYVSSDEASRIVGGFFDIGGNLIDTADMYGDGRSEEVVGAAVSGRRDQAVVATKVGFPMGSGPNARGLSRGHLTQALHSSLRRLRTDYIDLYQCHIPDADTPIEETMATLDGFVRAGKVRHIGCSNFTGSQIVGAQWAADRVGGSPFVSLQAGYSLLHREVEADTLPACERHGLGVIVYSPLSGGVLTGKYRRGMEPPPDSRAARTDSAEARAAMLNERNLSIAEAAGKIANDLDTTTVAVALAWLRDRPGVTSTLIGPRSHDQYEQYVGNIDVRLESEVIERLDRLSHAAI